MFGIEKLLLTLKSIFIYLSLKFIYLFIYIFIYIYLFIYLFIFKINFLL